MEQYLTIILFAAFLYLVLDKLNVFVYMQIHGNKFFNELASCMFCKCLHLSFISAILFAVIQKDLSVLLIAPLCSPVVLFLVKNR